MKRLARDLRCLIALLGVPLLLACGPLPASLEADDLVTEPVVLPASAELDSVLGKADGLRLYPITSVRVPASVGTTETRKVFTTAASFRRYFGVSAPVDFTKRWLVFYSAGTRPTGGYTVSIPLVTRSATGRTLEVTTRLDSPGAGCPVTMATTRPTLLASFAKPTPEPGAVRYYKSDRKPAACNASLCGDALRTRLTAVTADLLWMSESDYPFAYFERPGAAATSSGAGSSGAGPVTGARLLTLLGLPADTQLETRTLADMLSWVTRDDPAMDDGERATAVRYRAVRAALEENLTNLTVLKVGRIQVGVYFLGTTRCGDLAGLSTTAIET